MTTCGLCGDDAAGRQLCHRDTVKLAERLADLPTLIDELTQCLVPRRYGWGEIVSTKGAAGPRSPLDEDVLDEMSSAHTNRVIHSWRVDVQRVRWPHHSAPPPDVLAADCRWLAMELDWIAAHYPAAGDLAREVRTLESRARGVVGDPVPRPQQLGTCIALIDDQGTVCGAPITRFPEQTRMACRSCRTVYQSEQDLILLRHYQPRMTA